MLLSRDLDSKTAGMANLLYIGSLLPKDTLSLCRRIFWSRDL